MNFFWNRIRYEPVSSGDTETLWKLQNKSSLTVFVSFGNSDCPAFENQCEFLKTTNRFLISCTRNF